MAVNKIWIISPDGKYTTIPAAAEDDGECPDVRCLDDVSKTIPGGAYTTLRTFDHCKTLRLENHLNRLIESARLSGYEAQLPEQAIHKAMNELISSDPEADFRIRISLDTEKQPGMLYLFGEELQTPSPEEYQKGVAVITRQHSRTNPKAKSTTFIETATRLRNALPPGIHEAILVDDQGQLLEGTGSNFFCVIDGILWTADKEVLSGITRSIVLEAARKEGFRVRLEPVNQKSLEQLEEAFITSVSRSILPVREINGKNVGANCPGPVTRAVMARFDELIHAELAVL